MSNLTIQAMDLDDLKSIWLKEKQELEGRITLNEKLVKELAFDKAQNSFDKKIRLAIWGRNLALVYMTLSLIFASKVFYDFEYSIPAFIGGFAMLFSFFQHRALRKPDFSQMSTVELQKAICEFRKHTLKYSKFDISIVSLWFVTLAPIYFKYIIKINISLFSLYSVIALAIVFVIVASKNMIKEWDRELKESEAQLNRIAEFENN